MKTSAIRTMVVASALVATLATAHAQVKLTPERDLLSPDDAALKRKLQPFIHCMNTVTHNISIMVRPYRTLYAAVSKDPVNGFDHVFWSKQWEYTGLLFSDGAPARQCADGLTAATKLPPPDEALDKLADSFAADLRKLDDLAPKVEAYYDQRDYRDDKMARGRAMNAEYDPLLQRLLAGTHRMFVEVGDRNIVLERRRVEAIERLDGPHLRWQANAFMLQARATLRGLNAMIASKTLTKDGVLAQVAPLEQRYAEAASYGSAHPEESNDAMDLWSKISGYVPDYMTAAKETRRDASDPATLAKVPDHVERLSYVFDEMIGEANVSRR